MKIFSLLQRRGRGPILKPTMNWWENKAVFNCGAVYSGGRVHILYRAIGKDGISRFGYARSDDGIAISKRKDLPVFEGEQDNEYERLGCEDPRITKIGKIFYITYTATSVYRVIGRKVSKGLGSDCPWRVRVSLASTRDFKKFKRYGAILPKVDSKNAVLFPEKINGMYVMHHRIYPDMWIAHSQDMLHWKGHKVIMKARKGYWDSEKIGAGAPPIKTKHGWLEIYHGVDSKRIYRLGVALFDLHNPSKLIYRSEKPVLEPHREYELKGRVPNIVFTCGVVRKGNTIYVYYGGADRVIGVATMQICSVT